MFPWNKYILSLIQIYDRFRPWFIYFPHGQGTYLRLERVECYELVIYPTTMCVLLRPPNDSHPSCSLISSWHFVSTVSFSAFQVGQCSSNGDDITYRCCYAYASMQWRFATPQLQLAPMKEPDVNSGAPTTNRNDSTRGLASRLGKKEQVWHVESLIDRADAVMAARELSKATIEEILDEDALKAARKRIG